MMRFLHLIFLYLLLIAGISGCNQSEEKPVVTEPPAENPAPAPVSQQVEARTFPTTDSLGKLTGWGYDLYVNGKRTIHQDIIPAVPGNSPFRTEADAQKTGDLAAKKMTKSGSLPTISIHDLDSLQIAR
jgi:hypothetical protein